MAWGWELTLLGWELSPEPFLPVGTLSPVPQRVNSLCLVGNVRIGAGLAASVWFRQLCWGAGQLGKSPGPLEML